MKKICTPIFILILGLFLIQALICNFASAEGVDLAFVRGAIKNLEKENRTLETEIITFSSFLKFQASND